jgi:hypothetical protein
MVANRRPRGALSGEYREVDRPRRPVKVEVFENFPLDSLNRPVYLVHKQTDWSTQKEAP